MDPNGRHCLPNNTEDVIIYLNTPNIKDLKPENAYYVANTSVFSFLYIHAGSDDIALIKLNREVVGIIPIQMDSDQENYNQYETIRNRFNSIKVQRFVTIAGYGCNSSDFNYNIALKYPDKLQRITLPIFETSVAVSTFKYGYDDERMYKATLCSGDSGAPVMVRKLSGGLSLIGIHVGKADPDVLSESIGVRISSFEEKINKIIKDD